VGDVVTVNTKDLFEDAHQLMEFLKVDHDEVHTLEVDVDFTIEEINTTELAELNQELFDKLWRRGSSFDELKAKIKEDAEALICNKQTKKLLEMLLSS
jgi:trigger factor